MPSANFAPEIRAAMASRASQGPRLGAGLGRPRPAGIGGGNPGAIPVPSGGASPPVGGPPMGGPPMPLPSVANSTMPTQSGPPDLHKVAAATSIAHAILGGRNVGKGLSSGTPRPTT